MTFKKPPHYAVEVTLFLVLSSSTAAARYQLSSSSFLPRATTRRAESIDQYSKANLIINSIPRGGGGSPFDVELAQKLFVGAYGLNAAICTLSPSLAHRAYGLAKDAASERLMQTACSAGICHSVMLYLQLFQGMSYDKAVGWSTLPWVLTSFYQAVIAKTDSVIDFPSQNHLVTVAIHLITFAASQMEVSWGRTVFKLYSYWGLFNAVGLWLATKSTAKLWEVSIKNQSCQLMLQSCSYFISAYAINGLILAYGGFLSNAIGWSALSVAASLWGMMVTGGPFDATGVPKGPAVVWMLFLAAIAKSLLN